MRPGEGLAPYDLESAGRATRILAASSLVLAAVYLVNASIQGFQAVISSVGFGGLIFGVLLVGAILLLSRVATPAWGIGLLALAVATTWGLVVEGRPASDFANFYDQASSFAARPSFAVLHETKSPTTILMYGTWMKIAGISVTSAQLAGAWAHGVTAFSIALMCGTLRMGPRVGRFAALLFALSPGVVTYSSVVSSESALLVILIPGLAILVWALQDYRRRLWWFAVAGLLLGMSFLAVPVGGFFAIGALCFVAAVLIDRRERNVASVLVVLALTMAISPAFSTGLNVAFDGEWSPSATPYAAMGFVSGSSRDCLGRFCLETLEEAGFQGDNRLNFDEANARAVQIAAERWTSDPLGMLGFAVTIKVREMWRHESTHMLTWATRDSPRLSSWQPEKLPLLIRTVDAYHLAILALLPLAMVTVWRRRHLPLETSIMAVGLVGTGALHLVMPVQQRYHLVFLPFVFAIIALAVHGTSTRQRANDTYTTGVSAP